MLSFAVCYYIASPSMYNIQLSLLHMVFIKILPETFFIVVLSIFPCKFFSLPI